MDSQEQLRFALKLEIDQLQKLYPLEVSSTRETAATTDDYIFDVHISKDVATSCPRASKTAAIKACERIKNWTKTLSVAPENVKDSLTLYS